ncbi:EFR1 family ferrodoxin [Ruminococcus sp. XPD3002]|uniref:EFR1 family ferrodoxin n=1 Tax=Ruminococcus sp. XPD3002 TaxID=1452269 RepID=UPI00090F16AB|nr:4Fe-4S dicluster domain-containing protein [Ruminococcus flavefaciens]
MILYFTGTGNTKFAAEYLADHIEDELVSLNDILKYKRPLEFSSDKAFVVCAPIHAWGFPRIIVRLIKRAKFSGSSKLYFIGTMQSQTGDCDKELSRITAEIGMEYMGFCGIPMPNNYITGGKLPTSSQADELIEASLPVMNELSSRIFQELVITKTDCTPFAAIASGAVNALFNRFAVNDKKFIVSGQCTSCGKCEKVCPVNNIKLSSAGVPHFRDYCINCFSCINRCPSEAIDIGNRTIGKRRYVCPEYETWKKSGLIEEWHD